MKKVFFICLSIVLIGCKNLFLIVEKLNVVIIIIMIIDFVKNIGGDVIEVNGLMGVGVDFYLFKVSEGDVLKFYNVDVIFYNGLYLEGKLVEVFEKMEF